MEEIETKEGSEIAVVFMQFTIKLNGDSEFFVGKTADDILLETNNGVMYEGKEYGGYKKVTLKRIEAIKKLDAIALENAINSVKSGLQSVAFIVLEKRR
ncbi:MAG: hypothetical protein Q7R98_01370 [Candidatus Jorgensenbacteria bacterium]|nr:hypothetical protein [Candidatus Jorgensenbacteria bacterium]